MAKNKATHFTGTVREYLGVLRRQFSEQALIKKEADEKLAMLRHQYYGAVATSVGLSLGDYMLAFGYCADDLPKVYKITAFGERFGGEKGELGFNIQGHLITSDGGVHRGHNADWLCFGSEALDAWTPPQLRRGLPPELLAMFTRRWVRLQNEEQALYWHRRIRELQKQPSQEWLPPLGSGKLILE